MKINPLRENFATNAHFRATSLDYRIETYLSIRKAIVKGPTRMTIQRYGVGDRVRFQPYTQEAAEVDYVTGVVLKPRRDIPLVGQWVDIDFQGVRRRGVSTAKLELVRRAPKDAYDDRYTEDHETVDRERDWRRLK